MKRFLCLFLYCCMFLVSGWSFGDNSPYLVCSSNLGTISIYFPQNNVDYLEIENNQIINTSSSSIYGYSSNYRITFPTYSTEYTYRNYSSSQSSIFTIYQITENHLYDYSRTLINHNYQTYLIALIGGVLVICFWRR